MALKVLRAALPVIALGVLLSMAGCEGDSPKKTTAGVPAQANAPTLKPATPSVNESQTTSVQPQPKADPVEEAITQLINKAEKQYQDGLSDYQTGHLEAAKQDFDEAFNTLLSSSTPIHDNERLEHEFEKLVEGIRQLELQAMKQGDGFAEPRSEPAPIDEANDVTFPVDPNLKAKAQAEIATTKSDLPLMLNDEVASFINYFSNPRGKGTLERALARSGRYREMILSTLKEEGVPQDLIYLAQAESGFQPLALSRAGARGIWQFMAGRASQYDLERNWWVDERQDPAKSTRAAARHLKDLYNQFGDWYLAMAAYNSGPGTVQHAVERTGYADFWQLYRRGVLPHETRNYVPIILAVTIMAKNPSQYGLEDVRLETPVKADEVKIDYPVDLRLVAECTDTSVAALQELNPSLLRLTTPKDQGFTLRLPAGTADKYQEAIAAIPPDMRTWWHYHRVEPGESLASIARKYHSTPTAIAQANNLSTDDAQVGSKLIIPVTPGHQSDTMAYAKHPTRYKVRKGDTLQSVADDFEVPADKIRKWNHLRGSSLTPGRTLLIYKPVSGGGSEVAGTGSQEGPAGKSSSAAKKPAVAGKSGKASAQYHKVKKGETLSEIAESYNTTVSALRRDNGKVASNLHAGDVLVIRK